MKVSARSSRSVPPSKCLSWPARAVYAMVIHQMFHGKHRYQISMDIWPSKWGTWQSLKGEPIKKISKNWKQESKHEDPISKRVKHVMIRSIAGLGLDSTLENTQSLHAAQLGIGQSEYVGGWWKSLTPSGRKNCASCGCATSAHTCATDIFPDRFKVDVLP